MNKTLSRAYLQNLPDEIKRNEKNLVETAKVNVMNSFIENHVKPYVTQYASTGAGGIMLDLYKTDLIKKGIEDAERTNHNFVPHPLLYNKDGSNNIIKAVRIHGFRDVKSYELDLLEKENITFTDDQIVDAIQKSFPDCEVKYICKKKALPRLTASPPSEYIRDISIDWSLITSDKPIKSTSDDIPVQQEKIMEL